MLNESIYLSLKRFFTEIFHILLKSTKDATEIWCETYEINFLANLDKESIDDLIHNFDFISRKKGAYTQFYSINKISFIIEAIQVLEFDIKKLSNLIDSSGFEQLIQQILIKNGYSTIKNFRFSDKSYYRKTTKQTKYEVDVIGWKRNYLLLIDAKQWNNRDVHSTLNKAANLQYQRALALKKNPDILSDLIQSLVGPKSFLKIKLPLIVIPIMVTLEENWALINENMIPLVSIYKLNSFLQELKLNTSYFKTLKINKISIQKQLL